nr:phage protease [uncultured Campylobacter sp.]
MELAKDLICLELNTAQTNEKVKISPAGQQIVGYDGRVFNIDANFVVTNTKSQGVDILLDRDHFDGEAMGWFDINSLEARDDGIYASLEFTQIGKELVEKRLYRYMSPAYEVNHRDNGIREVVRIGSIGLVNRPNLLNQALNNQSKGEDMSQNDDLAVKFNELNEKNATLQAQVTAKDKEIEELKAALDTERNNAKTARIESAIKNGELLPNRKEMAMALEANALDSFLEVSKSEATSVLKAKNIEKNKQDELDIDPAVKAQLGL